ncbi:hypothetical protein M2152_002199 [Microbacteriaceae bacterium SG_E_30_P1]|uniref:Uncharacterized protein n=1 Tax=Antiquaquibacter oligotrophicus TaxID=2880260 RepID=A0ABT6KPU9_9MICO|nr:hypothetical protein [Antiquaquibacter oligotrophicus]MDH6182017.1 hypothetical protein [Antiquaquibacter oligotrophicus]UDF12315.1 hypothetical protein LH407_09075 [Antiquaquibacter oligotrophicus]
MDRRISSQSMDRALGWTGLLVALALAVPGSAVIALRVASQYRESTAKGDAALATVLVVVGGLIAIASLVAAGILMWRHTLVRRVARRTDGLSYFGTNVGEFASSVEALGVTWGHGRPYVLNVNEAGVSLWRGSRGERDPALILWWDDMRSVEFSTLRAIGKPFFEVGFGAKQGILKVALDRQSLPKRRIPDFVDALQTLHQV